MVIYDKNNRPFKIDLGLDIDKINNIFVDCRYNRELVNINIDDYILIFINATNHSIKISSAHLLSPRYKLVHPACGYRLTDSKAIREWLDWEYDVRYAPMDMGSYVLNRYYCMLDMIMTRCKQAQYITV